MHLLDRIRLFFGNGHHSNSNAMGASTQAFPSHPVARQTAFTPSRTLPDKWPSRVLFICSGNICRSAYAALVFQRLLKQTPHHTQICSAGTLRISGRMAAPLMIKAAEAWEDDLSTHRSSPLSRPLLNAADLIFIMSPEHEHACLSLEPQCRPKICYLSHWLEPPSLEIPDPMGQPYEAYQRASKQINEALNHWFSHARTIG